MLGVNNPWVTTPSKSFKPLLNKPAISLTPYQLREIKNLEEKFGQIIEESTNPNASTSTAELPTVSGQPRALGAQMHEFVKQQIIAGLSPEERTRYYEEQRALKELAEQLGKTGPNNSPIVIPNPDTSVVEMVHNKTREVGENLARTLNLDPRYPYRF